MDVVTHQAVPMYTGGKKNQLSLTSGKIINRSCRSEVRVRRVGATVNKEGALQSRIYYYKYKGYTGTLYLAKTTNMKVAENRLLNYCKKCDLNIQKRSNAQPKPGYVYVIEGPPPV